MAVLSPPSDAQITSMGQLPGVVLPPTVQVQEMLPEGSACFCSRPLALLGPDLYLTVMLHSALGAVRAFNVASFPRVIGDVMETISTKEAGSGAEVGAGVFRGADAGAGWGVGDGVAVGEGLGAGSRLAVGEGVGGTTEVEVGDGDGEGVGDGVGAEVAMDEGLGGGEDTGLGSGGAVAVGVGRTDSRPGTPVPMNGSKCSQRSSSSTYSAPPTS